MAPAAIHKWLPAVAGTLAAVTPLVPAHAEDAERPERLPSGPGAEAIQLYLEPVVNGQASGRIVPVTKRDEALIVAAHLLQDLGIDRGWRASDPIDVSAQAGMQASYSEADQRLLLTVPVDWLPAQKISKASRGLRLEYASDFGALINYDLYLRNGGGSTSASVGSEVRLFGDFGAVSTSGNYSITHSANGNDRSRFVRYDTTWTYVDEDNVRTWEAGDFITRTLSWTGPVRLGGLQVSRDFSVRPDIVTYPMPTLVGGAAAPSTLELYVDGYRTLNTSVEPGPFVIDALPYVNGAGEAVIVTTDAQGRQMQTNVPFYIANDLLRPGLADYAFSFGKMRRRYGSESFSYGEWAGSLSGRLGVTGFLTLEGAAEIAPHHRLAGVGGMVRVGNLGVIDGSASLSRQYGESGHQFTAGYRYTTRGFNLMARATFRSSGFADLSTYENPAYTLPKRQVQAHANVVLGENLGTIGAGYVEMRRDGADFRLATVTYNRPLFGGARLNVSFDHDLERNEYGVMARLTVPFGRRGNAVAGIDHEQGKGTRFLLDANQSAPSDGGIGWSAGVSHGAGIPDRYRADLSWRNDIAQVRAGAYGTGDDITKWGSATGSVVVMDGGLFLANRIGDGFVLVSTNGYAGVPVRYENQKIGETNGNGHLLVSSVPSYYAAKFEIDTTDLPVDVRIAQAEQHVAVRNQSGRLVRFDIDRSHAAFIDLRGPNGAILPVGTRVVDGEGQETWVGFDGKLYMENLGRENSLTATLSGGAQCSAQFQYDTANEGVGHVGPVICQ